jgi:protein phosphatase
MDTGQRTIVHIGTIVGSSEADVLLDGGSKPVHLMFSQVNPDIYRSSIKVRLLPDEGEGPKRERTAIGRPAPGSGPTHWIPLGSPAPGSPELGPQVPSFGVQRLKVQPERPPGYEDNDLESEDVVAVDGKQAPPDGIALFHQSRLTVNDKEYRCELYAWGDQSRQAKVQAGWCTDIGPTRENNEDAIGIYQHRHGYFFGVADGVGGSEEGERVSEFAIKYLLATFHFNARHYPDWTKVLRRAAQNINTETRSFSRRAAYSAGTTLTGVVIQGWDAYIVHVGDSRAYVWSRGKLRQVTKDHVGYEKDDRGQKIPTLTRGIGKADTLEPEVIALRLQPDEKILLCTDGISDRIKIDELEMIMTTLAAHHIPRHVVKLANDRYNTDNASAICWQMLPGDRNPQWRATPSPRVYVGYRWGWNLRLKVQSQMDTQYPLSSRSPITTLVLVLLLAAGILIAAFLWQNNQMAVQASLLKPQPTSTSVRALDDGGASTATRVPPPTLEPTETPAPTSTLIPFPTSTPAR